MRSPARSAFARVLAVLAAALAPATAARPFPGQQRPPLVGEPRAAVAGALGEGELKRTAGRGGAGQDEAAEEAGQTEKGERKDEAGESGEARRAVEPGEPGEVGDAEQAREVTAVEAAPERAWQPRYHGLEEVRGILADLATGSPERAATLVLGQTWGGVEVPALELGAPGPPERGARPTVFLLGGLDGVSLAGSEAVLAVASELLEGDQPLPAGVTLVAVPWAAPDALASWVEGRGGEGVNPRPVDDDLDGSADEDGPDDLDGDGLVLDLLIEDPDGPWTRCSDPRLLRRAGPTDAPRYRLRREGRDDDGDGRYNEDGPGGVLFDANFPVHWKGPWEGVPAGPWPLSEPFPRTLADAVLERPTLAVLVFQGSHGQAASPGGYPAGGLPYAEHRALFAEWSRRFGAVTGRGQEELLTLARVRGGERPGAAVDWFYVCGAALSFELAPWGPAVGRAAPPPMGEPAAPAASPPVEELADPFSAPALEARWYAWLDDEHGGIGFRDWTPVDLAPGVRGLVGGWAPRTRVNPPPEKLEHAVAGLASFVRELAQARPVLEIEVLRAVREPGGVCRLRARVRNAGALPSGLSRPGTFGRQGARLALELPEDGRLLTGAAVRELPHLPGRGVSAEFEWLFTVPPGALFALRAEDDWTSPTRRELRL